MRFNWGSWNSSFIMAILFTFLHHTLSFFIFWNAEAMKPRRILPNGCVFFSFFSFRDCDIKLVISTIQKQIRRMWDPKEVWTDREKTPLVHINRGGVLLSLWNESVDCLSKFRLGVIKKRAWFTAWTVWAKHPFAICVKCRFGMMLKSGVQNGKSLANMW